MLLKRLRDLFILASILLFTFLLLGYMSEIKDKWLTYNVRGGWSFNTSYINRSMGGNHDNIILAKQYLCDYYTDIQKRDPDDRSDEIENMFHNPSAYYGQIIDLVGTVGKIYEYNYDKDSDGTKFDETFKDKVQFICIDIDPETINALIVSNKYANQLYKRYNVGDKISVRGFIVGKYKMIDDIDSIAFIGIINNL